MCSRHPTIECGCGRLGPIGEPSKKGKERMRLRHRGQTVDLGPRILDIARAGERVNERSPCPPWSSFGARRNLESLDDRRPKGLDLGQVERREDIGALRLRRA